MAKRSVSRPKKSNKVKIYRNWNKKFLVTLSVLVFAIAGTLLLKAIFAAPVVTFSLYATHPNASKAGFDSTSVNYYTGAKLCSVAFCPVGQTITDIQITSDGQLIAGYGDWNANVDSFGVAAGKVGIVPLYLNTNTWGSFTLAGSESLENIRKIDDKIYAAITDPSDTRGSKSGYVTNESGVWEVKQDNLGAEHIFDVATLNGTDRWEMGAIGDTSGVWRSVSNNGAWAREPQSVPGGYARYYWGAAINGRMYIGGDSYSETAYYDGVKWTKLSSRICSMSSSKVVVAYENNIICPGVTYGILSVYDGSTVTNKSFGGAGQARDFYIDGSKLYVIDGAGGVYEYTTLASAAVKIGQMPAGVNGTSVAVYNGYLYVGSDGGKIYRSDGIIGSSGSDPVPPSATQMSISGISPGTMILNGSTQSLTIGGTGFPSDVTVKIGKTSVPVTSRTDTQVVVSVNTATIQRNEKIRRTTTKSLAVVLSASGYNSVNAPPLTVSYTK